MQDCKLSYLFLVLAVCVDTAGAQVLTSAALDVNGEMEFNLGQYASCVGWNYWIFTIRQSGRVERASGQFMVNDFAASTDKLKPAPNGFRAENYDRMHGKMIENTFRWNRDTGLFEYLSTGPGP
ncbi:MAG: hypothetical protein WBW88_01680 [Rhodothermales bacterium]